MVLLQENQVRLVSGFAWTEPRQEERERERGEREIERKSREKDRAIGDRERDIDRAIERESKTRDKCFRMSQHFEIASNHLSIAIIYSLSK